MLFLAIIMGFVIGFIAGFGVACYGVGKVIQKKGYNSADEIPNRH